MNSSLAAPFRRTALAVFALLLGAASGCKSNPPSGDDSSLDSQVQSRLSSDQNLSGQSVRASVAGGAVTLDGTVTSDTARVIASQDVAQIPGVRRVIDQLVVQAPPVSATASTPAPTPIRPEMAKKPSPPIQIQAPPTAPIVRNTPPPAQPQPAPAPAPAAAQNQPPPGPPPRPAPVVHTITLIAGTTLPIRINETLDSASTQTGDKFTGTVASDIVLDDLVVLPQGTPVTGRVDSAQDAAHFKGSSLLTVSLTSINRKGEYITVATEPYSRQGEGRGKNTAEKTGGGAVVGAILGGIFGGGKGAAIGAAAGAGAGAGANGITRGQQVQIPSETVVRFKLSDPITVKVTSFGASPENSGALEHRSEQ